MPGRQHELRDDERKQRAPVWSSELPASFLPGWQEHWKEWDPMTQLDEVASRSPGYWYEGYSSRH